MKRHAPEIDPALFRRVMGRFATGVTIITARDGEGVRGMTANAFMSGSLEPPLMIVSVAKRAHMHALLLEVPRFGVSFLGESQEALSEHFAGKPDPRLDVRFEEVREVPVLASAAARIAAETAARHDCGDHTIFIGHILGLDADNRAPLVYHSGRYHGLDRDREHHEAGFPWLW